MLLTIPDEKSQSKRVLQEDSLDPAADAAGYQLLMDACLAMVCNAAAPGSGPKVAEGELAVALAGLRCLLSTRFLAEAWCSQELCCEAALATGALIKQVAICFILTNCNLTHMFCCCLVNTSAHVHVGCSLRVWIVTTPIIKACAAACALWTHQQMQKICILRRYVAALRKSMACRSSMHLQASLSGEALQAACGVIRQICVAAPQHYLSGALTGALASAILAALEASGASDTTAAGYEAAACVVLEAAALWLGRANGAAVRPKVLVKAATLLKQSTQGKLYSLLRISTSVLSFQGQRIE